MDCVWLYKINVYHIGKYYTLYKCVYYYVYRYVPIEYNIDNMRFL